MAVLITTNGLKKLKRVEVRDQGKSIDAYGVF